MTTFRLYRCPFREDALSDGSETSRADLAKQGLLDSGSNVEAVSTSPPDVVLDAQYRRLYPERYALSLAELLESQTLQELPLAPKADGETSEWDGYYAVDTADASRVDARTNRAVGTRATLTKEGTRSNQRRVVQTHPKQLDPGNVFGNDLDALVGIPADATRVVWYDRSFSESTSADIVDTVSGRFGDVDLYDARAVQDDPEDQPQLVYKSASYDVEGDVDVGVWDTYGTDTPQDVDGALQWGRVFDRAHDPRVDDELVIENGLIRLWLQDGTAQNIRADEWDPVAEAWSPISLPTSDWQLVETDLVRIGAAAVDAQCVFANSTAGDDYTLDMRLERGRQYPQWLIPESVGDPIPSGLEDLLDPIADESVFQTGATLGLVARRKLRK
jgi:hypothetical protein